MNDDRFPPPGTGESTTAHGEDLAKKQAEPGRIDLGVDEQGRPAGGSSARLGTSIDPKDAVEPSPSETSSP